MGKHAQRGQTRVQRALTRLTHHPRVARLVGLRDRMVLGTVATVVGLAVLVGCNGGDPGPRQLEPTYGEVGSGW